MNDTSKAAEFEEKAATWEKRATDAAAAARGNIAAYQGVLGASFPNQATGTLLGAFDAIAEKVNARTADLIRGAVKASDPEAKKIGDYYASCMDEAGIEAAGLKP